MLQFTAVAWQRRREFGPGNSPPSLNHMWNPGNDSRTQTSGVITSLWYQILQPSLKDHFISRNRYSLKLALAIRNLLEGESCETHLRKYSWSLWELESYQPDLLFASLFWEPLNLSYLLLFASPFHSLWRLFFFEILFLLFQTFASFIQLLLLVNFTPHSLYSPKASVAWLFSLPLIPLRETDGFTLGQVTIQSVSFSNG